MESNSSNKKDYNGSQYFGADTNGKQTQKQPQTHSYGSGSDGEQKDESLGRKIMSSSFEYLGATYLPALQKDKAAFEDRKKRDAFKSSYSKPSDDRA
jgi:hypothetical protein